MGSAGWPSCSACWWWPRSFRPISWPGSGAFPADRDRFIERSMGLVVVDELDGFALSWSRQPESDFDALKDRGIATVADRFDIGFHTIEPNSRIPRPALNQQHAAGGNAGQESLGRSDL